MDKSTRRRLLIWGGAGLALVVLIAMMVIPQPELADFAAVTRGDLEVTVEHEGKTRVRDRFVISAPLSGRVLRIELEPGDPVLAGETVLASFRPSEPAPLDARSRAEAQAQVRSAQSGLEQARAERERVRAQHAFAATELERVRRLAEQGIASRQALDSAEAEAEALAEALASAEAGLRTARHQLEMASARMLEPGGDAGGDGNRTVLTLRSPVDGVVINRLRESEVVVAAGEPLLEVADLADLEVVADFLSTDAVKMRPGMRTWIDRWGGDRVLPGRVRRVEPGGFLKISALGVEEQRVNVRVDFDHRDDARDLGDGYRVEARVVIEERREVLKVPVSSLFRQGEGWAVFVADDGEARLRPVEVGARNSLEAEVVRGLSEGETVIVHPADEIADGTRVEERGE